MEIIILRRTNLFRGQYFVSGLFLGIFQAHPPPSIYCPLLFRLFSLQVNKQWEKRKPSAKGMQCHLETHV